MTALARMRAMFPQQSEAPDGGIEIGRPARLRCLGQRKWGTNVNRREAIVLAGAAVTTSVVSRSVFAQSGEDPVNVSRAARTLYARALVFDANCGAPLEDTLP